MPFWLSGQMFNATFQNRVGSLPKRLDAVIAAKGERMPTVMEWDVQGQIWCEKGVMVRSPTIVG